MSAHSICPVCSANLSNTNHYSWCALQNGHRSQFLAALIYTYATVSATISTSQQQCCHR
ncbi:hypothetical protein MUCCIDRAFT_115703 [Mucor lusitanicus CBS 277.49]|uniref:Uncharacterized protein n=1 Tax=Mucor lusitanicus CBS 277.49 TaxID=747725 RepID=A0A168GZ39_MUCCL|nr:hypothetical protein MUCCIDRAFT_115703 [Mucor lusitanicus CBS 277.49]